VVRPEPSPTARSTTRLVVTAESRELRSQLSPTVWAVLEEVALDATGEDDALLAATSSRRIAEQLRMAPSTAASALLQLRRRRLLHLEQRNGTAGRFGLAVYTIAPIPGLTIEPPCAGPPSRDAPCAADEDVVAAPDEASASPPGSRRGVRRGSPDQAALDLGWSGS